MTGTLRTFYVLLITQTLSYIGSAISTLAFGFWIFERTGQATPLTLVTFFSAVPTVLASGLSGVLTDRWDRRKVMAIADLGQAACTVFLLFTVVTGSFELWHLYLATVLTSAFGAFQVPAFQSSITLLIPPDQRVRANSAYQIVTPMTGIIAPVLAGVIYGAVGVRGAIGIDLLTFLIAFSVVIAVRIPKPAETAAGRARRVGMEADDRRLCVHESA